ncbi:MAG TPA: polysaccharide biosynthesis protein, partial [Bacteroidales bacterium]|nr:polysaccharide biosynthesis protein [Bacteroidales bacterium]
MIFTKNIIPAWVIFIVDVLVCIFSVILAFLLRFNFSIPYEEKITIIPILSYIVSIRIISFLAVKTYAGIIRHTSSQDLIRLFLAILAGSIIFSLTNIITFYSSYGKFFIPFSIIIIDFITTTFALAGGRLLIKTIYYELFQSSGELKKVIIFGAGEGGLFAKRAFVRDVGTKYKIIAFLDDDPNKIGKKLENIPIYPSEKLEKLLETKQVTFLILSTQKISFEKKNEIADICMNYGTKILEVPPLEKWINGELSFRQIKKINIEDLLGRNPIKIENEQVRKLHVDKIIMITGAAGSIGSELVRQTAILPHKLLLLIDQAETPLFHLELELASHYPKSNYKIIVGDICNEIKMRQIFEENKPNIIYHAAAYKHVPMMENNPIEAVYVNVYGTKLIADLALEYNVEKFVMISTDKAVNPTNVMGASKRIAEIYIQSLNSKNKTKFITTRFGNVLGSNGSVIPLFKEQIEKGGPITITHPEVTRYFMTIPEACQLVMEAGSMGNGGEIFIFDMG